ncbi:MAG: hypothetical protein IKO16_00115 [Lachnospiraceae bacterium]|nr:hypothetical protein [Lachnospiraceae bacterium]
MADNKNKRTAPTIQDVLNGQTAKPRARFKSGYTGPRKALASAASGVTAPMPSAARPAGTYRSGGILDYAWIAYCVVLSIALTTAVIAYVHGVGKSREGIYYPNNVFTINGVVKDIFADYRNGGLGSAHNSASSTQTAQADAAAENTASTDNDALLGQTSTSSVPNSTTGATMTLDVGDSTGSYPEAASYEELLTQLDSALAAKDIDFVGSKLSYEDEESKTLIGYPQSVVEHFTQYMADNSDKRETFLAGIKDESEFSAKNGSAYLVKLPLLQFTINMGYDQTTISISGFSDQTMDSGQSAIVSPLLPCMYTIHAETAKGSQTSEVECNMNEGNLKINIGVTD